MFTRLFHALFIFGRVFLSYLWQWLLCQLLRGTDPSDEWGDKTPAWLERRWAKLHEKNAEIVLQGTLELRGVYIKLGQVLSVMGGFLPPAFTSRLETLQDAVPPQPFAELERVFHEQVGQLPSECFAEINEEPIAAASLGQVHEGRLKDGRRVALKILYPGIRSVIWTDMKVVRLSLVAYKAFVPVDNIEVIHDALKDLLRRETDYEHEARCMTDMAANFADADDILFPEVIEEFSRRDVLTMTFMEGTKINKVEEFERLGIDREALAKRLVQCFYRQVFVDRFFHADPHPGNFLVQPGPTPDKPRIVVLDFGAISHVADRQVDGMVDVLRGFLEQEDALVMRGIDRIGFHARGGNRELLEKTIKTYFQKLLKIEDRSAKALVEAKREELELLTDPEVERDELRDLMRSVRYPEGWFYVERASVMMFWLSATIDPSIDTLSVGFPYVMPLIADRMTAL